MAERVAGPEIERLIQLLARLPGLGPRSARRAALHLMRKREELLAPLADACASLMSASSSARFAATSTQRALRDLHGYAPRRLDAHRRRDRRRSLGAGAGQRLHARYHVLGGVLSPLDGVGPDDLNLAELIERVQGGDSEVILAVNATVDGQTTAHYIADLLAPYRRQDDAPGPRRAGRRRARLSRRGHARRRARAPHGALRPPFPL